MRHSPTSVRAGRYRTRTAAEATAACGGNREPRLGPRSDFSKPCQGAAEKSANATRTGASRQIPSRFPTRRNVYQERCRQTIRSEDFLFGGGTGREQGGSDDASRQSKGLLQNSSLKKSCTKPGTFSRPKRLKNGSGFLILRCFSVQAAIAFLFLEILFSGIGFHAVLGGVVIFHQGDVVFRVVAERRPQHAVRRAAHAH